MEYALVTETGESFLTHTQLLRHIREKCGDAIADYLEDLLGENPKSAASKELLHNLRCDLECVSNDIDQMAQSISVMVSRMEQAGVVL